MEDLSIRPGTKEDWPLLYNSWLKEYKQNSRWAKRITNDVFFSRHHAIIDYIFNKQTTKIMIAHPYDDSNHIVGYMVMEELNKEQIIHFCFVKFAFRRLGLMKEMFKRAQVNPEKMIFTHWTYVMDDIFPKFQSMTYDPYRL